MPVRQGPEAVAAALVATLTTYMPSALDTVWSSWSGGDPATEKTPPKVYPQYIYKFRRQITDLGNYPYLMVSWVGSRQTANGMTYWDEEEHRMEVAAVVASDDWYVLEATSARYAWAVRAVLLAHPLLDGSLSNYGGHLDLGRMARSQVVKYSTGSMEITSAWEVLVTVQETV